MIGFSFINYKIFKIISKLPISIIIKFDILHLIVYKLSIKMSLKIVKNWLVPFEGSKRCCRYLLVTCKILFRKGEGMFLFFRTFFETFLFFLCGFWYRLIVQWWEICYFNYSFIWLIVILLILTFGLYGYLVISFLINYCKQLVIVYGLSVIDIVKRSILFPDVCI